MTDLAVGADQRSNLPVADAWAIPVSLQWEDWVLRLAMRSALDGGPTVTGCCQRAGPNSPRAERYVCPGAVSL